MKVSARRGIIAAVAALSLTLSACGGGAQNAEDASLDTPLKVGALAVPAGKMLTYVAENLAEKEGIKVEFVEFNDYNTPNPALADGSIDANLFQHQDFLDTYNKEAGGNLESVGEIYLPAAAFHSKKHKSLDELPDGAVVSIPNDPTNEGRALELLQDAGVIKIEDGATKPDGITENKKNFKFQEVDNASLPRTLEDDDAAFVTSSYAIPAKLTKDTIIASEEEGSKYYNVLATRPELKDDERIEKLHKILTSQDMADFINEKWDGLILPNTK
ncbi:MULTISPECIES: MetQ/NlpA family ABC transporter substrate-binding protein [unclassified Brevibacterium]|uniref:MetQ/NlpA family ABC transporter substrate-binding protein n=1 Tax=unclassified Brevibacterium TaxID=2614124 RepID=UPI0008A2F920|nr:MULTISPECIES: MetQ/NlpA family ABC transporter substrate-binding protein [unclassified Brevibacterium]OFL68622.1 NLPA lipoprotein [Brevibacterium sp. HMSC063G07]